MAIQISKLSLATGKAKWILPDPYRHGFPSIEGNLESSELPMLSLTLQLVSGKLRKVLGVIILQMFLIIMIVYLTDYCYFK